jgi:hypothetical protein
MCGNAIDPPRPQHAGIPTRGFHLERDWRSHSAPLWGGGGMSIEGIPRIRNGNGIPPCSHPGTSIPPPDHSPLVVKRAPHTQKIPPPSSPPATHPHLTTPGAIPTQVPTPMHISTYAMETPHPLCYSRLPRASQWRPVQGTQPAERASSKRARSLAGLRT